MRDGNPVMIVLVWFCLTYPLWSPKCRAMRRDMKINAELRQMVGESWSEDEPLEECFYDTDDGLDPEEDF